MIRGAALALLLVAAQQAPLPSGVRRWRDMPVGRYNDRTVRRFLEGSSHDFARMSVSTVRLQNGRALSQDSAEQLLIVKAGRLRVAVNGEESLLGPGSIAVLLAGDASRVTGDSSCTFYRFSYRAARARSD